MLTFLCEGLLVLEFVFCLTLDEYDTTQAQQRTSGTEQGIYFSINSYSCLIIIVIVVPWTVKQWQCASLHYFVSKRVLYVCLMGGSGSQKTGDDDKESQGHTAKSGDGTRLNASSVHSLLFLE